MPPAPRPLATPEWRALVQYRIEQVEIDILEIRQRVNSIETRERDSVVDLAELRERAVTRSNAPDVLRAADLAGKEVAREAGRARLRQAGWSLFFLVLGFALREGWIWWVGPK